MADKRQRIVFTVTDDQLAFIERSAADEGVDNATLVRMVIDRLSKGRAPLISMMATVLRSRPVIAPAEAVHEVETIGAESFDANVIDANDLLAQRAAEAEARVADLPEAVDNSAGAAVPLRMGSRGNTLYNPGRQ